MFFIFMLVFNFYFMSWYLNRVDRPDISHKVKVPRFISVFLNPFSDRTVYDIKSVIYELYSHITIVMIIVCFFNHSLENFNKSLWYAVSIAICSVTGGIALIRSFKLGKTKTSQIMRIVAGVVFVILAVFLVVVSIFQ